MCTKPALNNNEVIIGVVESESGDKGQIVKITDLDAGNIVGYVGNGVFYKIIPFEIQVNKIDSNVWSDSEGNKWVLK